MESKTHTATEICIIGCGVAGLTTGIALLRAGYAVEIRTEKLPMETTSAIAAAIWFPYRSGPVEAVNRWSRETYAVFETMAANPETGVSMVDFLELVQKDEDAWWLDAVPGSAARRALPSELPPHQTMGWVMRVPMIETPVYLPYLSERFQDLGGRLRVERVQDLSAVLAEGCIVVNCTGLQARELVPDGQMFAIQGQLVKVAPIAGIPYVAADSMPDAQPDEATYVFPRRDCIVLGGTAKPNETSLDPDPETTRRIISRCQQLVPALRNLEVIGHAVGLRPGRSSIRIERLGRLIHNYGHGGAGFTVSWGCANEVVELVRQLGQL